MKIQKLITCLSVLFLFISMVSIAAGQENQTGPFPEAVFPAPVYEFPSIVEGLSVKHDFKVQNKGSAELKIQKVRTG